jgi:hypothetical protein
MVELIETVIGMLDILVVVVVGVAVLLAATEIGSWKK